MKKYNIPNYVRYKNDLKSNYPENKEFYEYSRNDLIVKFLPLVENVARKFSTTEQASGVLDITDLIQHGAIGLCNAVDKLDKERLVESLDIEKTIKSFFSKRIRGAIRRGIDTHRGGMRIPEHKLNEIRKNDKNKKMVAIFFNSMFLSTDAKAYDEDDMLYQIPDTSEPYNMELLNAYLKSLLLKHLNDKEYQVLRLSYGLDCDKHTAKQIAVILDITGASDYVRVSELKKQAINKLIESVDHSQVLDYL